MAATSNNYMIFGYSFKFESIFWSVREAWNRLTMCEDITHKRNSMEDVKVFKNTPNVQTSRRCVLVRASRRNPMDMLVWHREICGCVFQNILFPKSLPRNHGIKAGETLNFSTLVWVRIHLGSNENSINNIYDFPRRKRVRCRNSPERNVHIWRQSRVPPLAPD